MLKPWHEIPILHSEEPLAPLPDEIFCIEPHPYRSLGAPYREQESPWMLREKLIKRLLVAQNYLQEKHSELCLAVFDAWRPIRVQRFMYEHAINQECFSRGLNGLDIKDSCDYKEVLKTVNQFWAEPSLDRSTPPPHSTGAAVDLTLAFKTTGESLDMGGEIDFIGSVSSPLYYSEAAQLDKESSACLWHSRRMLLKDIMSRSGFVQHPNEWWHFSYGDQLWAWSRKIDVAYYGSVNDPVSNSMIS